MESTEPHGRREWINRIVGKMRGYAFLFEGYRKRFVNPQAILMKVGRILPLRHRYVLTRRDRLRLRYVVLPFFLVVMAVSVAGFSSHSRAVYVVHHENEPKASSLLARHVSTAPDKTLQNHYEASQKRLNRYGQQPLIPVSAVAPSLPQPREKNIKIGQGDTLTAVLQKAGVSGTDAYKAVSALKVHYDPRNIRPGQEMYLRFDPVDETGKDYRFSTMKIAVDSLKTAGLKRIDDGGFQSFMEEKETHRRLYAKKANIEVSLYGSAAKAGLPAAIIAEAIHIFSWDVDFQRDIRRGDLLEVMYEQYETEDGAKLKSGDIIYARLNVNGHDVPVYRFELEKGEFDYFTKDGASIRKALMKTPIDGARISSGYGKRKHPVLGYNKVHKGVDFAAPTGTPIYAAGDGVIDRAGRWSSYGNYIRIRHNSSLKTAYAHLKKFAKGITAGKRVKQGQVIGYVGTTGRSTGAHLHYEVLKNGTQVNPRKVKLPQGKTLQGKSLQAFKAHMEDLNQQYAGLLPETDTQLAAAGTAP